MNVEEFSTNSFSVPETFTKLKANIFFFVLIFFITCLILFDSLSYGSSLSLSVFHEIKVIQKLVKQLFYSCYNFFAFFIKSKLLEVISISLEISSQKKDKKR